MPVTEFRSDMRLGLCTSSETSNKPFFSCWAALPRPVKLLEAISKCWEYGIRYTVDASSDPVQGGSP
jgi:hypothetical protein